MGTNNTHVKLLWWDSRNYISPQDVRCRPLRRVASGRFTCDATQGLIITKTLRDRGRLLLQRNLNYLILGDSK